MKEVKEKLTFIVPIDDKNSNFHKVYIGDYRTPHCLEHGAMLKVSPHGLWRCITAVNLKTGKTENDCRAGCVTVSEKEWRKYNLENEIEVNEKYWSKIFNNAWKYNKILNLINEELEGEK